VSLHAKNHPTRVATPVGGHDLTLTLDRVQAEYPGMYADGLLRTVQRRVKIWRAAMAHQLVFEPFANTAVQPAEAPL
jgi:hypothetical protein